MACPMHEVLSALPPKADILSLDSMSAMCHKRTCTFGVIVEPTRLADFRAKGPRVTLGVTPK